MSKLRVEALEQPDGSAFIFNNKNIFYTRLTHA